MKYSSTLAFILTLRSSFTCFFLSYWLKHNICSVKSGYYSYSKNNWVNISIHFNKCLAEYVQICNVHVKSYSFKVYVTLLTSHEYTIFCIPCSWCSLFFYIVVVHVVNNFSQFLFCLVLSFNLFLLIFLIVVFLLYSIITILIHLAFKLH